MSTHPPRQPGLYTVGHSTHEWPVFLDLLSYAGITAIADVRSSPYSRFNPQYNRDLLTHALKREGIAYVFLGDSLGARRSEVECYVGNQARYELIAKSPLFREGLDRVRKGVKEHRIALMCAEKDPITCHRMVLVTHALKREGIESQHIREDGTIESNDQAEDRLLDATGLPNSDLFQSRDDLVEQAYQRQGMKIAWSEPEENATASSSNKPNKEARS